MLTDPCLCGIKPTGHAHIVNGNLKKQVIFWKGAPITEEMKKEMSNTGPFRGKPEKAPVCKNHPNSTWGRSPFTRTWYPRCREGNKKNEECERVK